MTRIKLKERDSFPRYLAASQNNTININVKIILHIAKLNIKFISSFYLICIFEANANLKNK
jgi:hypothetical protein